jgi:hypothetical protein
MKASRFDSASSPIDRVTYNRFAVERDLDSTPACAGGQELVCEGMNHAPRFTLESPVAFVRNAWAVTKQKGGSNNLAQPSPQEPKRQSGRFTNG